MKLTGRGRTTVIRGPASQGRGRALGPREFSSVIDSTQDRAVELAREGAPTGTRVVAREQRRGRGRVDRAWYSPPQGGLYLSMVLAAPPSPRTLLSVAVGLSLREALRREVGLSPWVKWPNDLVLEASPGRLRKLAGILIDEVARSPGPPVEVVGVGLNVRSPREELPRELRERFTSLEDWMRPPPTLESVEEWVAQAIQEAVGRLTSAPARARVVEEASRVLYGVGRPARVDGVLMGVVQGVGSEGELWLVENGERTAIRAGDVEILR